MSVMIAHDEAKGFYFIDVAGQHVLALAFNTLDEAEFYALVADLDVMSDSIVD